MPGFYGFAADLDVAALSACSRIVDDTDRLACFDEAMVTLQGTEYRAEELPTDPAADAEVETQEYMPLTDDIGRETVDQSDDTDSLDVEVRGRVVRCETDVYGKYYFYFDNGQVWKQNDGRRLTLTECDYEVAISKDFFGYKMQPVGQRRKLRISRVR